MIWQSISIIILFTLPIVVFYTIKNITIDSREGNILDNDQKNLKILETGEGLKF